MKQKINKIIYSLTQVKKAPWQSHGNRSTTIRKIQNVQQDVVTIDHGHEANELSDV